MNAKIIFVLTSKGRDEIEHKTSLLFGDMKRALSMVDGNASFGDLSKRAAPSLRSVLSELMLELNTTGFIEDKAKVGLGAKIKVPTAPATKSKQSVGSELDFTSIIRAPSAQDLAAEAARFQAAKQQAELQNNQEQSLVQAQQANAAQERAELEQRSKEHNDRVQAVEQAKRLEAEQAAQRIKEQELARVREEVEQAAKQQAEQAARAKQEAEAAKLKAEQELARARQEAEQAKQRAETEARNRAEAEQRAKQAAELARKEAEQLAKQQAEQAARAKQEAEAAKLKAEQELARARQEAEQAKQRAETEARNRAEAEQRAKQAAELARKEAEQLAKQQAEQVARAKQEAEAAKLKAEQELARARQEAEQAKQRAETEARNRAEAEQRAKQAAELARKEAEQLAKQQAEQAARAKQEAEAAKLKAEQELAQVRLEAEQARKKAELAKQQAEVEAQARQVAEQQAAENRAAALALQQQEQAALLESTEQQALKAREEEEIRAKQHALSAMSTQVRHTPFDTESPAVKLAAIDLSGFAAKPAAVETAAVQQAVQDVTRDKQAERDAELVEQKHAEKLQAEQATANKLAEQKLAEAKQAAEAKKLADSQAKAWVEAEQRAVASAQAHADVVANPSPNTERRNVPRPPEKARVPRKPLPWGGMSVTLLVLLALAAWLVPQVMPMQEYVPKIEAQLSTALQQPVHVGKLSARLLPSPRLTLSEVYIGEMKQVKAQKVQLNFGFSSLFADAKRIDRVELQEAELNVSGVLDVANWFEKLASDTQHPITTITFERAKLSAPAVQFEDLTGEMKFGVTGKFAAANVSANGGKYVLQVSQGSDNKLDTTLNVHGSALPLLPNWEFADLTAKGELSRSGFMVNDFDGRIAGGSVQGSAKLDWSNGWNAQGTLAAKAMTLVSFSKLLEGDMDGNARFKLQAATLDKLADSAQLDGNFAAKKGVISGADVVETARLRSKENLPGGRTHFDDLSGNLNYSNNAYHFKQLKIKSGVLNANGSADISNRQLAGRLGASLSIQEGVGAVELQLSGNIDTPNLRAR